ITLKDRIDGAASGRHSYSHFNPAVGAVYTFVPEFATYARYSVSNRAPTPMELTCSNPAAPCRLPNDFIDDPHLDQVVAKTVELGGRGHLGSGVWGADWDLSFFQTMNHDDIQFISTAAVTSNQGFFKNMGKTRHRGVEFTLRGYFKDLNWFLGYTYLDAEYRESFQVQSPEHPDADSNGLIDVKVGNRIPLTPHNLFKLGADYAFTPKFRLGATLLYTSDQVM